MNVCWSVVFLLLSQTIEEKECKIFVYTSTAEVPADVKNRTEEYGEPIDFRCHEYALEGEFNFDDYFLPIGYAIKIDALNKQLACIGKAKQKYPILTGTDPMMPYYINNVHRGIQLGKDSNTFLISWTPLQRTKEYCASIEVIATAFREYWEKFHTDIELCKEMVDIIRMCYEFPQMRDMFVTNLYDKLCLSEDGCYNLMDYYEEGLPFCVKYTAISEFKNSSVGSWHHEIINYCKLSAMIPEAKDEKYDKSMLTQSGRKKEKLTEMCLYLRYRLLPAEGKEQEISDDAIDKAEYDTLDTETTTGTEYENGASIAFAMGLWWNIISLLIGCL